MAIHIEQEHVLSLREACKHPAFARSGRPLNLATLYRYVQRGSRGVLLESIRTPSGRKTSREAIARFIDRLSDPALPTGAPTPNEQFAAHRRAEAELDAAGI